MSIRENNYCVILAGGHGLRLWPCSRDKFPKQFVDFFGIGKTQLQQTFERFAALLPESNIFICTHEEFFDIVKQQLPQLPTANILAEPVNRNTAPAVAWAVEKISRQCADANIIIAPSDQAVFNEEAFAGNVSEAFDFVENRERSVVLGVKPTRPEPGYGYIQVGDAGDASDVYKVKSFTEKPEREFAKMFMESGEFYWNTGVFISNAKTLKKAFGAIFPEELSYIANFQQQTTKESEEDFVKEHFPLCPNTQFDCTMLEKSPETYVMVSDFGWADLGTWHSTYEAKSKTKGDNVVIASDVIADNCTNSIIKVPKGRLAVINGLDGYIVAEEGNVLLICKKEDSSALIRKYVNELRMKRGEDFV